MKLNLNPLSQRDPRVCYNKVWLIISVAGVVTNFLKLVGKGINFAPGHVMASLGVLAQSKKGVGFVVRVLLFYIEVAIKSFVPKIVLESLILKVLRKDVSFVKKRFLLGQAKKVNTVLQDAFTIEIQEKLKVIVGLNIKRFTLKGKGIYGNIVTLWKKRLVGDLILGNKFII